MFLNPLSMGLLFLVVSIAVVIIILNVAHKPLKGTLRNIKDVGVTHFTQPNFAAKIIFDRCIKSGNDSNRVYFFGERPVPGNIFAYNVVKHHGYDATNCITISNLSEAQLSKLRIRICDNVIEYRGSFIIEPQNKVVLEVICPEKCFLNADCNKFKILRKLITALIWLFIVSIVIFFISVSKPI